MKHKVFVLNYSRSWNTDSETVFIEGKGNLEELNALLDDGWNIDSTIQLEPYNNIQSIVYNLRLTESSKSYSA